MKTSFKSMMLVVTFLIFPIEYNLLASELVHEFKNPAFSGNGYSQHVLSIDQLETQRKEKVEDDEKSAAAAAAPFSTAWGMVNAGSTATALEAEACASTSAPD